MGIRKYKPTTPGRRGGSVADFVEITRDHPEKSLVRPLHSKGGRNAHGRITTRHQGGGHKRAYRLIDFRRNDKDGVPATVAHIAEAITELDNPPIIMGHSYGGMTTQLLLASGRGAAGAWRAAGGDAAGACPWIDAAHATATAATSVDTAVHLIRIMSSHPSGSTN